MTATPASRPPRQAAAAAVAPAVAWAALAEASILALPVHVVVRGSGALGADAAIFGVAFAAVFTAACVLVDRYRGAEPALAVAVSAIAIGVVVGGGSLEHTIVTVVATLLVGLRVLTLSLRDWGEPIGPSLMIGAIALGLECLLASGSQPDWTPALVVVVPLFFAASLASRTATIWAGRGPEMDTSQRRWPVHPAVIAAMVGVLTLAAVALGGLIDRIGSWLSPFGRVIVVVAVWIVSQLLRPVFWLFERAALDPEGAQQLLERIRERAEQDRRAAVEQAVPGSGSGVARVLAFLLLLGLVVLSIKVFRRIRAPERAVTDTREAIDGSVASRLPEPGPTAEAVSARGGTRPTDTIRGFYAEILNALARRGLEKPPEVTPAEFERTVVDAVPQMGPHFGPLTRAYEAVRYGATTFPDEAISTLDGHRRSLLAALRRAPGPLIDP